MAIEGILPNGLVVGHAYSITDARYVCICFHEIFVGKSIGENVLVVKQFYNAETISLHVSLGDLQFCRWASLHNFQKSQLPLCTPNFTTEFSVLQPSE